MNTQTHNDHHGTRDTKAGFVSIIGLPNAGKSTLLNTLVGNKVSIVSRKVQTTRNRVLGITVQGDTQIIFIDTPGIFVPKKTLEKAMVRTAYDAIPEGDIVAHLVDVTTPGALEKNRIILDKLNSDTPTILVLNKVDQVKKSDLLHLAAQFNGAFRYNNTFMISALHGQGTTDLITHLISDMPNGPFLFDEDQISDMPMRLMAAEITREKIFDRLHQELPYSIMVYTENWEEFENNSIKINQVILVERDSQKGIVLGKSGQKVKEIGTMARQELEEIMGTRIHLKLFVKVQENWAERPDNYRLMGLEF